MLRNLFPLITASMLAIYMGSSDAQAQVYYYPSTSPRIVQQNRGILGTQKRIYSNNDVRYQSYRSGYGQTQVYSNGRYYVQPNYSSVQSPPVYYSQPTPYYSGYSNNQPTYYGNQGYWNQPSTTYQSNYGTGFYSPQQAANTNTGAIIGDVIGGQRGAQIGAAIGATIRP